MQLHLFGASTPAGEAFKNQLRDTHSVFLLFPYSRAGISCAKADFNNPGAFRPDGVPGAPGMWISFAPIWFEVDGFYWTVLVPDIVNSGREEQGSVLV